MRAHNYYFLIVQDWIVYKLCRDFEIILILQAFAGDPLRSGVGVLEGVREGVRFVFATGDRLTDLEGDRLADLDDDLDLDLDLERESLLLLSLLGLRFNLSPAGDRERGSDLVRLSERAGDLL